MYCQNCGAKIDDAAVVCVKCGVPTSNYRKIASASDNSALKLVVPIGVSGFAIAAGYLGLLAIIPIFGQLAIIFGALALNDIKNHPEKSGTVRAWIGIVLGSICTIVHLLMLITQ